MIHCIKNYPPIRPKRIIILKFTQFKDQIAYLGSFDGIRNAENVLTAHFFYENGNRERYPLPSFQVLSSELLSKIKKSSINLNQV